MEQTLVRLTVSLPCYGRPQRTIRAVECIAKQKSYNFEALVTGDGCDVMDKFIKSNYFEDLQKEVEKNNSKIILKSNAINYGGHGYAVTNEHIRSAKGNYFIFYANDDVILENHFENYLGAIENTNLDFAYFNSYVAPHHSVRNSELKYGHIGHSELIVKTSFLQSMPPHTGEYGHDWHLIDYMLRSTNKYKKAYGTPTYWVMSLPNAKEKHID